MKAFSGATWRTGATWGCWFRVFGYGLYIGNMTPLFSERYGYTKVQRIGSVKVKLLLGEAA